jgi:uncharacterized protein YvpB
MMRFPSILLLGAATGYFVYRANRRKILNVSDIELCSSDRAGSELSCAAALLKYYHCNTAWEQLKDRIPKSTLKQTPDGAVGKSPKEYFIGNSDSADALGCYAPVVAATMNTFLVEKGWRRAADLTGTDFSKLLSNIDHGDPVIIWATRGMKPSYPGRIWKMPGTKETFTWIEPEHCFLLVGYDGDGYYFCDPDLPDGIIRYERKLVEERYNELGSQAIAALVY